MEIEVKTKSLSEKVSVANAFWENKETLSALKPRFQSLIAAVGHPGDLFLTQWAQLAAMTLDFKPDLIIELGRGRGNSTCAFTETVRQFSGARTTVASFCLSDDWEKLTKPKLELIVDDEWFKNLKIYNENILVFPFEELLARYQRCLIFWDAHGFEIAECVLGKILPLVAAKNHLVIMHDLSDSRYSTLQSNYYGNNGLWTGNNWSGPRLRIGHIDSAVEQAIAILDFTTRNKIELYSADHDLDQYYRNQYPERHNELMKILGDDFFSLSAHWFYFTLNERAGTFTFPALNQNPTDKKNNQDLPPEAKLSTFRKIVRKTRSLLSLLRREPNQTK